MKKIFIAFLSIFLLASCATSKTPSLEEQLANDFDFSPLNVELTDYEADYARSVKSSFLILNSHKTSTGYQIDSTGSGFAYMETLPGSFYIVTNHHVVQNAEQLFVVSYTGQIVEADLIGIGGKYLDIAVIHAKGIKDVLPAKIYANGIPSDMGYLMPGDEIYALGTPSSINLFGTISKGVVSNAKRIVNTSTSKDLMEQSYAIQIDVPINPGNSGGPLFNKNGEVVGVNTFKLVNDVAGNKLTGVNFALPIHDVVIAANSIISSTQIMAGKVLRYGLFKPFSFGSGNEFISVHDLNIYDRNRIGLKDDIRRGVYINKASNMSLVENAIIVSLNGEEIEDVFDLRNALLEVKTERVAGQIMDVNGTVKDVTFMLI